MQKVIITSVIALLFSFSAMAQDKKVAVFDPSGSVDNSIKEIIREEVSSIIVNTGNYTVLERKLIDRVLEENRFQSSGLVDDSQMSEMGKRLGANYVFVSTITMIDGKNYHLSCKLIDVQTARIEKQRTALTRNGENELLSIVQKTIGEMFDVTGTIPEIPVQKSEPKQTDKPLSVKTEYKLGIVGGTNIYTDKWNNSKKYFGLMGGVGLQIVFPKNLTIQPEILYSQKKFIWYDIMSSGYECTIDYLEVLFKLMYRIQLDKIKTFAFIAPYGSCSFRNKSEIYDLYVGSGISGVVIDNPFKPCDLGIGVGAGFDVWKIRLSCHYSFGLLRINKDVSNSNGLSMFHDNIYNRVLTLSAGVFFN